MSKQNFKSQAKRKRELAKLDKRQAKDQKRAARKADQQGASPAAGVVSPVSVPRPPAAGHAPASTPKPLTLAEAVLRWKSTKVAKPKAR